MRMAVATESRPRGSMLRRSSRAAGDGPEPVGTVGPPPRLRRHPLLVVGSVVAVCLGALLAAWAYSSVTTAQEVVGVRSGVLRGETITRDDLVAVRVGVDPALHPIAAARIAELVGQRAARDLSAGGLVTAEDVAPTVLPAASMSVVGVSVPVGLLPGEPLVAGDAVRVVATPGQQGDVSAGPQRVIPATVVGVHSDGESGQSVVSVQVPSGLAPELASLSSFLCK